MGRKYKVDENNVYSWRYYPNEDIVTYLKLKKGSMEEDWVKDTLEALNNDHALYGAIQGYCRRHHLFPTHREEPL